MPTFAPLEAGSRLLDVDAFAKLRAQVERRGELDVVLRDAGVTLLEWRRIEQHWLAQLDDAESGEGLIRQYVDAYRAELTGDSCLAPPPAPTVAVPAAPSAVASTPRPLFVPSYLQPSAQTVRPFPVAPAVESPAVSAPRATAAASGSGGTAELATPKRPVTLPFETPARPSPSATLFASVTANAPALPFDRGAAPSPQPSSVVAPQEGTGTVALDAEPPTITAGPEVPLGVPNLTVEQYAWVVATLKRATPLSLPTTLERLRLTPTSRAELEARWRAHLARHPDLKQLFIRALAAQLGPNE